MKRGWPMPDLVRQGAVGPRIRFLLGGVQKAGTTALAAWLASHPALALPRGKEAHVFDAPDFEDGWDVGEINARFAAHFHAADASCLYGDATPITMFHPALVGRVARYNPAMRWVIVLRDPVDRAISHYFMERSRGNESRPLWVAALLEHWRLQGRWQDWSPDSPLRVWSYAARGRYARQLDVLLRHFPRGQVLLLRSRDLAAEPAQVAAQLCRFLDVAPWPVGEEGFGRVFAGRYQAPGRWSPGRLALRWLLRGEKAALVRRHSIALD